VSSSTDVALKYSSGSWTWLILGSEAIGLIRGLLQSLGDRIRGTVIRNNLYMSLSVKIGQRFPVKQVHSTQGSGKALISLETVLLGSPGGQGANQNIVEHRQVPVIESLKGYQISGPAGVDKLKKRVSLRYGVIHL
jgi:hypothetical protein